MGTEAPEQSAPINGADMLLSTASHWSGEPIALRMREAVRISGFSRSEIYRRAARGQIVLLKCGSRTLIEYRSLHRAVLSLPRAMVKVAT
ncbi:MAG TPA: hypothetical protein VFL55_09905 [Acetobacteraceae bacterium]|nr:hypothetical protein [Acetobacteraceae bacterium]